LGDLYERVGKLDGGGKKGQVGNPIEVSSESEDEVEVVEAEERGTARKSPSRGPSAGKGKEKETGGEEVRTADLDRPRSSSK
jgi:hypothetical protein